MELSKGNIEYVKWDMNRTMTEPGGRSFEVSPNRGRYQRFCATVPMRDGEVTVKYENGCYEICATVDGGTAVVGHRRRKLISNEIVVMRV